MTSLTNRYVDYYTPLIQSFIRDVSRLNHPSFQGIMPEPFLPLFGGGYETSSIKIVIAGQDTLGWGNLLDFIKTAPDAISNRLIDGLDEFRQHPFVKWGPRRQTFWGFAMMLLASIYGRNDWEIMKTGGMPEILDSFAWANCNAVELYGSTVGGPDVSRIYWDSVRAAAAPLNRLKHIVEVLRPQVVVIMYRGLNTQEYFEGYSPILVSEGKTRIRHYRIENQNLDIIHVPHPGSMNRIEGADYFRDEICNIFTNRGIIEPFPRFIDNLNDANKVMNRLLKSAPKRGSDFGNYQFASWVADELVKEGSFMSIPTFATMINNWGGRTSYGAEYEGGRGTYRFISCAYHWHDNSNYEDGKRKAKNIAISYRKPNFEYAYDINE